MSAENTYSLPVLRAKGEVGGSAWQLLLGDARALAGAIPEESVDTVVTSPPYYWQRDYDVDGQIGMEWTIQGYVDAIVEVFEALRPALKKSGNVFLNLGDTYYNAKGRPHGDDAKHRGRRFGLRAVDSSQLDLPRKSLIGIPWRVALAMQEAGWTLRSDIIWQRRTAIPEWTSKDRPWRQFEHVFLFSKAPRYFFNRESLGGEEDIWSIEPDRAARSRGTHYAPYPRELVRRCLLAGCPEEGTVLDPFVGGGTTMYEAMALGRSAIGVELNPEFCDLIEREMQTLAGQDSRS